MSRRRALRIPEYLQHILDAIDRAMAYVAGMDIKTFEDDTRTQDAVLRGDTEKIETREGFVAVYSSRVRTLIDAVYDWSRFNSLPRAYGWIRRELAEERAKAASIVDTTLRYGDKGTIRRIGALLESESIDPKLLRKLEKALSPSTGLIPWIPGRPKRGTINRRWGVVLNEQP